MKRIKRAAKIIFSSIKVEERIKKIKKILNLTNKKAFINEVT